jgi:alkanesulfonate monooxygenase SsuD/methylene tetrahydromethanopterin reductase-like flavin-dependent oxidoreductase (luciferase family)
MVDVISGGRLEFGIGLGNTAIDFQVFGIEREESRARFDEAAEVILKAWTQDRWSHNGAFWSADGVSVYPRPVQQPHPPLWVAGLSPDSLGWAGRHGCSIMTVAHSFPPDAYEPGMAAWRQGLTAAGLDATDRHVKLHLRVWVDEDADRAKLVAEAGIAQYEHVATVGRERRIPAKPGPYDWDGMLASGRNAYGTPEQCISAIQRTMNNYDFDILSTTFNYGGIPHVQVMEAMRLFAREVMPAFS